MKCSRCGGMLQSVLERTRGLCSMCHVLPPILKRRVVEPPAVRSGRLAPTDDAMPPMVDQSESPGEVKSGSDAIPEIDSSGSSAVG